jgi:hypothetical protein
VIDFKLNPRGRCDPRAAAWFRNQFAAEELTFWLPPAPAKMIDPRPNVAFAAKAADIHVTRDGLIYASDWNTGLHVLEYPG